jgi:hypothetical protein
MHIRQEKSNLRQWFKSMTCTVYLTTINSRKVTRQRKAVPSFQWQEIVGKEVCGETLME